jgi:hypothetical protein
MRELKVNTWRQKATNREMNDLSQRSQSFLFTVDPRSEKANEISKWGWMIL